MWELKASGNLAENETGMTMRVVASQDGLFRVKKNYKTVATFKTLSDAKDYLEEYVYKLNGETDE